jgi:K+-sensing histidine kinase KdpD
MNANLAAAVAHDVKNRLVILGEELAKLAALPLAEPARVHLAVANEQAMQVTSRLVEWLTVQKADVPGGLRATPREEVPEYFLADWHADAMCLAKGRVEIVREAGSDLPAFWFFDAQLVRLALDSALHNALRFATARITLGAAMKDGRLIFSVHDDGPGVQTDGCATSTGLGSTVCRQVAMAHKNRGEQGHCDLRDHHAGGAIFELSLP